MNIKEKYHDARQKLLAMPGVVSVGMGFKQKGVEITSQFCLRVYVKRKKKQEDINPSELIPVEVNGIPTDVLSAFKIVDHSNNAIRPLKGGIQISQYKGTALAGEEHVGTLGCIARKKDDSKFVVLTNQHILEFVAPIDENHMARQPMRNESTFKDYENIVGAIAGGTRGNVNYTPSGSTDSYQCYVDCAIALINDSVKSINYVDEIGILKGSEDLTTNIGETNPGTIKVRKKGISSGLTTGIISEFDYENPSEGSHGQILIEPAPSSPSITLVYRLIPGQVDDIKDYFGTNEPNITIEEKGDNRVAFSIPSFSTYGDSGSVVIVEHPANSGDFKVVGLLRAGTAVDYPINVLDNSLQSVPVFIPNGKTVACHIGPVMERLNIEILEGNFPTSGAQLNIDELAIEDEPNNVHLEKPTFVALRNELENTALGRRIISVIDLHSNELIDLVHHHRPVKVVWHRYKCPAFAMAMLNAIQHHEHKFVTLFEGIPLPVAADNLLKALIKSAGNELKESLTDCRDYLLEMTKKCESYHDVIHFLKTVKSTKF